MFDRDTSSFRHRNAADVTIKIAGEPARDGVVFLTIGQRVSDLLNDERDFLPVRMENGEINIVAKSQIASICERIAMRDDPALENGSEDKPRHRGFDPYATLRVARDASIEEIRTAYKKRMKAVHPDAVAALDLDEDLEKAALLVAQRVNYAYQKIMREREDASTEESVAG